MAAKPAPPIFYKIKNKPTRFNHGSYTYKVHPNNNMASIMADINAALGPSILVDGQIREAEPGIYTWIIKGEDAHFYAARVFSDQEIGTLHQDIHRQTGEGSVKAAGELRILPDGHIQFNIQSGTYTRDLNEFHKTDIALIEDDSELKRKIQEDAHEINVMIVEKTQGQEQKSNQPSKWKSIPYLPKLKNQAFNVAEIETMFRMTRPYIKDIKERMKRRIILYKRDRMIHNVKKMLCHFFRKDEYCDEVIFLSGGDDDMYLADGTLGNNFEVLAGISLLSEPIITTQANKNRLNKLFKRNTVRKNHNS